MRTFAMCVLSMCAAGCSSLEQHSSPAPEAAKVEVFESYPQNHRPYQLVKRVWVESFRSAFFVPGYDSVEEARRDFQDHAVALGGDAVMNFGCYRRDANIPHESKPALLCNGNIIKYL